jgi:hypothetical protein
MFPPGRENLHSAFGEIDFAPSPKNVSAPAASPRKRRGPYKVRQEFEYQDVLVVIDPAGETDPIFQDIAKHRAAIVHYDHCVDVESAAEEGASGDEWFHT